MFCRFGNDVCLLKGEGEKNHGRENQEKKNQEKKNQENQYKKNAAWMHPKGISSTTKSKIYVSVARLPTYFCTSQLGWEWAEKCKTISAVATSCRDYWR